MLHTPRYNHGFTLIELLLYVAILALFSVSLIEFLPTIVESRIKNESMSEVEQQGSAALQTITYAIRNAASLDTPSSGESAVLILVNHSGNKTYYRQSDGVLEVKETGGQYIALTNSRVIVSNLTFTLRNQNVIDIQFTITNKKDTDTYYYSYQQSFRGGAMIHS